MKKELTKKDLELFKKRMEQIKNDPVAQAKIRKKMEKTAAYSREQKKKGRFTPEDWQERMTT